MSLDHDQRTQRCEMRYLPSRQAPGLTKPGQQLNRGSCHLYDTMWCRCHLSFRYTSERPPLKPSVDPALHITSSTSAHSPVRPRPRTASSLNASTHVRPPHVHLCPACWRGRGVRPRRGCTARGTVVHTRARRCAATCGASRGARGRRSCNRLPPPPLSRTHQRQVSALHATHLSVSLNTSHPLPRRRRRSSAARPLDTYQLFEMDGTGAPGSAASLRWVSGARRRPGGDAELIDETSGGVAARPHEYRRSAPPFPPAPTCHSCPRARVVSNVVAARKRFKRIGLLPPSRRALRTRRASPFPPGPLS